MTINEDDYTALRETLKVCLRALNEKPNFGFHAGDNRLDLPVTRTGTAKSYDLAARVQFVLIQTVTEA